MKAAKCEKTMTEMNRLSTRSGFKVSVDEKQLGTRSRDDIISRTGNTNPATRFSSPQVHCWIELLLSEQTL